MTATLLLRMLATLSLFLLLSAHKPSESLNFPDIPTIDSVQREILEKFGTNDEQKLFRHVFRGYDKAVRPVFNASHMVNIFIGLTLTHIYNFDERNQVLALNVWVEQSWKDERFQWNPADFGGLTKLTLPTGHVWTPDIVLYNNARDFNRGFVDTNLHASFNGEIQWAPPQKIYSRCQMDVSTFPFDHQFCSLIFRSCNISKWPPKNSFCTGIYDLSQLDLRVLERYDGKDPFARDSFTENGEWHIIENRTFRYELVTGNARYATVVFEIHLQRRMLFFLYNIIAPCVMLSILTMMQFVLPCESGEKVTLGLTVLLAYSVFSFNIAESMPETSEVIPLIAIYLMAIMAISALSVAFSVFVLSIRHGADTNSEIPLWLDRLGFHLIGPIFGGRKQERKSLSSKMHEILICTPSNGASQVDDVVSKKLVDRVAEEQQQEELIARWSHLANIFDRFFFCCVLMLTSSVTVVLLFVAPNVRKPTLAERQWSL